MMKNYIFCSALLLAATALVSSCSKDSKTDTIPNYTVPKTYDFTCADYNASTQRVKMGAELNSLLGTATTTTITLAKANDYFNNTNAPFTDAALNTSGISLAQTTADATVFTGYFTEQANNS